MIRRGRTLWARWIALLLLCYPRSFRSRFGADLAAQYDAPTQGRRVRAALEAARDLPPPASAREWTTCDHTGPVVLPLA